MYCIKLVTIQFVCQIFKVFVGDDFLSKPVLMYVQNAVEIIHPSLFNPNIFNKVVRSHHHRHEFI